MTGLKSSLYWNYTPAPIRANITPYLITFISFKKPRLCGFKSIKQIMLGKQKILTANRMKNIGIMHTWSDGGGGQTPHGPKKSSTPMDHFGPSHRVKKKDLKVYF